MARSLDGLIRHLLDHIALCGAHGASTADFIGYVKSYYSGPLDISQHETNQNQGAHCAEPKINIDRPLLEQVWRWLTKNPEIRVGEHAGHQHLTLPEVEERNADVRRLQNAGAFNQGTLSDQAISTSPVAPVPVGENLDGDIPVATKTTDREAVEVSGHAAAETHNIVVAAAFPEASDGATADSQNKHEVESGASNGVALAPATFEATSILTSTNYEICLHTSENRMWHALTGHGPDVVKVKPLDFDCLSIIARFGSQGILQHHLTRLSGQDKRSLPSRTDRLHEGGYIIKEQLAVREGALAAMLHTSRCVLKRFAQFDTDQTLKPYPTQVDPTSAKKKKKKKKRPVDDNRRDQAALPEPRPVPQWTADRSISNQIFDLVDGAGVQGMSMSDIRDNLFGTNVKKVAEEYVSRLAESWQISQPLHLRHLSIVRDTALKGKSQIYMYYTFANFQKLVDGGRGFWEAVSTVPDHVKQGDNVAAALNAQPDVDEHGFPKLNPNDFQGHHDDDVTLADVASALGVGPMPIGHKDPILKQSAGGEYGKIVALVRVTKPNIGTGIKYRKAESRSKNLSDAHQPQESSSSLPLTKTAKTQGDDNSKQKKISPGRPVSATPQAPLGPKRPLSTPAPPVAAATLSYQTPTPQRDYVRNNQKPRGRPRKYPRTGVPENIESMSTEDLNKLRTSQGMAEKYEKIQIENEIMRGIEEGDDPVLVTERALAAADDSRRRDGEDPMPMATRTRILYDYAGGPEPDPATAVGKGWISKLPPAYQPTRRIGRRPRETTYLPSMAAHSYPTHVTSRRRAVALEPVLEKRVDEVKLLANRTRRKRTPVPDLRTLLGKKPVPRERPLQVPVAPSIPAIRHVMQHLPSVAAHSWPISDAISRAPQNTVPRKRARHAEDPEPISPQSEDQSSQVASLESPTIPPTSSFSEASVKRKRTTKEPRDVSDTIDEGLYPGWIQFMSKYYESQLKSLARPHDGVFLGNTMPRRKRPGEPNDLRPKEFKVVVFKLANLRRYDWFVPDPTPLKSTVKHIKSQSFAMTPKVPIMSPDISPIPKDASTASQSKTSASVSEAVMAARPEPSNASHSVNGNGTKRKRDGSPQPAQGTLPISPSPRRSPPSMGVFKVTKKPNALLNPPNLTQNTSSLAPFQKFSSIGVENSAGTEKYSSSADPANVPSISAEADGNTTSEAEQVRREPEAPNDIFAKAGDLTVSVSNVQLSVNNAVAPQTSKHTENTSQDDASPEQARDRRDISSPTPSSLMTASQKLAPPTETSSGPTRKSFGHMSRQGGSSAILRKNIIMDLVEKCGGVFPNHREMCAPFAVEWHKKGQEGFPEPKTLQTAVTALCSEGKIRRITFTAQTSQGLIVTKDIIVLASIDNADPRVKELQSRIVAAHPRLYIPTAVMPLNDPRSIYGQVSKLPNIGVNDPSGSEAGVAIRSKAARRRRNRRDSQDELNENFSDHEDLGPHITSTSTFVSSKLLGRLSGNTFGSIRKVQRLATLQGTPNSSVTRPLQRSTQEALPTDAKGLTWLPSEYAFSELNFEDERPTILEPAITEDTHRRYGRYATIMGQSKTQKPKDQKEQAKRRIRGMAQKAAEIERHQAEAKASKPSYLYSDSTSQRRSKLSNLKSSFLSKPTSVDSVESPSATPRNIRFPPPTTSFGSTILDTGPKTLSQSTPKAVLHREPSDPVEARETQTYVRSLLVGFMDPIHYYHKQNGTFSVSFSGIQPPRKIIAHRGTCVYPFTADVKTVNPTTKRRFNAKSDTARPHDFLQPSQARFVGEVDKLLAWELNTPEVQDAVIKSWPIINYTFPHPLITAEIVAAEKTAANGSPIETEDDRPRPETQLKRRRLLSVADRNTDGETFEGESRPIKYRRLRGPRSAKYLGENGEQRLLTAVLVVRTLTGGIEKHVDWVLIAKVFEPEYDQMFVHGRWNYVATKYRFMIPKLESDFQDLFAQAYEEGSVPVMDFDTLGEYDWKWLVDWVMAKIDTAFQSQPELPSERDRFQELYTIKETSEIDITDFYEIDRTYNTKKRTHAINRSAYIVPVERARPSEEEAEQLATAKSWVRANVITPQETYNSDAARAKLSIFPEDVVEDALKQLLLDKTLMQENKGRLVPGRNYDISEFFLDRLRKRLLSAHFERAIAFKRQLDADFATRGYHTFSDAADDGDVLAVFNLMANKCIAVVPIGVPLNKWGLLDGYESRFMDKKRLKFDIELRPSPDYVAGNPLHPYPPPPSQHLQDPKAKIPTWYDIHGSLVPVMWEMCLAAVLCILAMRPGAGSVEIEKAVRPAMQDWEIESVLEWLVEAKAAKREGTGYNVEEWWWLALGGMEELDPGENASRGKGTVEATGTVNDLMVMDRDD